MSKVLSQNVENEEKLSLTLAISGPFLFMVRHGDHHFDYVFLQLRISQIKYILRESSLFSISAHWHNGSVVGFMTGSTGFC